MQDALNAQIKEEMASAHLYLSMAAYFHSAGFDGMAHWMKVQTKEEMEHAMKLFEHIIERGGRVEVPELEQPQKEWSSPLEAFQAAYKHEQYITGKIHDLVDLAEREKDRAAANMLQWYVDEQVEEEANAEAIINKLEMVGDSGNGMLMMDQELGQRTDTPAE